LVQKIFKLENTDNINALFGDFDKNLLLIEKELAVTLTFRDGELKITGEEGRADDGVNVLKTLTGILDAGDEINEQTIRYAIAMAREGTPVSAGALSENYVCISAKGKPIKAKTLGQKKYIESIKKNTVVFGIGPAGTGKTYLAVALAVEAFRQKCVNKIILTRPAVEAGEKLGFLPGDLQNKVDPYLRPLYDALSDMLGAEGYQKYFERGLIEVAPLAYMRGRTLDNAYIILDEAQNTTPEQMKMFLTRIGFGSKVIVTGDVTQIDLPEGKRSGLKEAERILKSIEGLDFVYLTSKDVVRHPLVQSIINAYEKSGKSPHQKTQHKDNRQ
jgi:phosphate starvation-inducible PhoH-like protein